MTPLAYEAWEKRWNRESKSRKVTSDAFEVYREMYGEESAREVVELSVQHPSTSHELPRINLDAWCTKHIPSREGKSPAVISGEGHGGTYPKSTIRSDKWASTRPALRNTGNNFPPNDQGTFDRTLWASTCPAVRNGGEAINAST